MAEPKLRFKDDNGNDYPSWGMKKLENLTNRIIVGLATSVTPYYRDSGIPILRNMNIKKNYLDDSDMLYLDEEYAKKQKGKMIKKGDVLTVHTGSNIGLTCMVPDKFEGALSFTTLITSPKSEILNSQFLCQFMNSNIGVSRINALITAGGKPNLNSGDLVNLKVSTPCLEEQQKIADLLSSVDEVITILTEEVRLWEEKKKGIMLKIFSQEVRFKDENGKDYPEWEEKTLGEICTYRRGSFPQPYGLPEWYDDEHGKPFIQVADVNDDMKVNSDTKRHISQLAEKQSVFAKAGTLIITLQGTIGRVAITHYDAYVDRTLLIMQNVNQEICLDYFKYALYLLFNVEKRKADGGTIKTITKETLTGFTFMAPCLEEQQKIADCLSGIDEVIVIKKQKLETWKNIKKGLLQQMFV